MTPAPTTTIAEQIAELEGLLERATPWRLGADLIGIHPDWRDAFGNNTPESCTRNGFAKSIAKVPMAGWRDIDAQVADAELIVAAINALPTLISALKAGREDLEGRAVPEWPISVDGPHSIDDKRRWLARQLMDSKLSAEEAFDIVAYHPAIKSTLSRVDGEAWTLKGAIYEGFSTEIWCEERGPGKRTIAVVRDYQDALAIMNARAFGTAPTTEGRLANTETPTVEEPTEEVLERGAMAAFLSHYAAQTKSPLVTEGRWNRLDEYHKRQWREVVSAAWSAMKEGR
jgi:hypothetical protein